MSIARCLEINARLRAAGIVVHEYPGWEAAGNGQSAAYEGGLVHHTASDFGIALPSTGIGKLLRLGRSNLSGPLCNYAGNEDGSVTLIAAHPANHAGASGGRSMGPLPVTTLFNRRVMGFEIVYPGFMPMTAAQYRTALIWSRIVTDVCGYGDVQRARAHAETSITGKWDPGDAPSHTINMATFRAAAGSTGAPIPPIVSQQEDDDMPSFCVYRATDPKSPGRYSLALPGPAKDPGSKVWMTSGWGECTIRLWFLAEGDNRYLGPANSPTPYGDGYEYTIRPNNPGDIHVPNGTVAVHAEWTTSEDWADADLTVQFAKL